MTVQGVVAVRLVDTGREDVLRVSPGGIAVVDAEPQAVLAGRASEVLLALWGRRPLSPLVTGDEALVRALLTG